MGYTTEFYGEFKTTTPVDDETYTLLKGIAETRRMKRSGLPVEYGIDGEFYFENDGDFGQSRNPKMGIIVDYNSPPSTQPGLWCQWLIDKDKQTIEWDGGEKFYRYIEWLEYIINRILKPKGYVLNGSVKWYGEMSGDEGTIVVVSNDISIE